MKCELLSLVSVKEGGEYGYFSTMGSNLIKFVGENIQHLVVSSSSASSDILEAALLLAPIGGSLSVGKSRSWILPGIKTIWLADLMNAEGMFESDVCWPETGQLPIKCKFLIGSVWCWQEMEVSLSGMLDQWMISGTVLCQRWPLLDISQPPALTVILVLYPLVPVVPPHTRLAGADFLPGKVVGN